MRKLISEKVSSDSRVLDAGAGAGEMFSYDLKSRVREVVGADLDPRVESNPQLHRGIVTDLASIPVVDDYFDMIFSRYVFEHVQRPSAFLKEMNRLLRPGGSLIFLTPNKWHYVALAARLTPHRMHERFNRMRGRGDEDTFSTVYRLNSASDLRRELRMSGFVEERMTFLECCPNYLTFAQIPFLCGVAYERFVNSSELFAQLRVNILGCSVKK